MKADDIVPFSKNAKAHPAKQLKQIANSIKDFGWRQPIVVDRDGVIIVGHGRWLAFLKHKEEMNLSEPRIEIADDMSEEEVRAYRLADNKTNESLWLEEPKNLELGALFEKGLDMEKYGFTRKELMNVNEEIQEGEIEFTKELMEENNYVVLIFDNMIDWESAKNVFELKQVQSLDSKKGYRKVGIGRVIDGKNILNKLVDRIYENSGTKLQSSKKLHNSKDIQEGDNPSE